MKSNGAARSAEAGVTWYETALPRQQRQRKRRNRHERGLEIGHRVPSLVSHHHLPGNPANAAGTRQPLVYRRGRRGSKGDNGMSDESPTWHEGWDAHAAGWGLPSGHTPPYIEGWRAREAIASKYDAPALYLRTRQRSPMPVLHPANDVKQEE